MLTVYIPHIDIKKLCFSILTLNEVTYFSRGERLVKLMK